MKAVAVTFKPLAHVHFGSEEMDVIFECASKHYDGYCRRACEPGGFMWAAKNFFEHNPEISTYGLNTIELDVLSKILEVRNHVPAFERVKLVIADSIESEIRKLFLKLKVILPAEVELDNVKL